jgi:hypothetical protein
LSLHLPNEDCGDFAMSRIFISWSGDTLKIANAISDWVRAWNPGTEPWVSSSSIAPGKKWREYIDAVLKESDCAIVCIGPESIKSSWMMYEIGAIGHSKPVIPLVFDVDGAKLPSSIHQFQHIVYEAAPQLVLKLAQGLCDCLPQEHPVPVERSSDVSFASELVRIEEAIARFRRNRIGKVAELLRNTRRYDTLVEFLRYIDRNPSRSPQEYAESSELKRLMGKKNLVVLALMLLQDFDLIETDDFLDITGGRVNLTRGGDEFLKDKRTQRKTNR